MPFTFLDDQTSKVSSPLQVKPNISASSVGGSPKAESSKFKFLGEETETPQSSFQFQVGDAGERPNADDLQGLMAEGYKPNNEDLRTIYEAEQNRSLGQKALDVGKGVAKGAYGVVAPFFKAVPEIANTPSEYRGERVLASIPEGIVGAASGLVGLVSKPFSKAYNYFSGGYMDDEAAKFQKWKLNYLATHDVGQQPLPRYVTPDWVRSGAEPLPETSSVVSTVASIPFFEAGAEATGVSKLMKPSVPKTPGRSAVGTMAGKAIQKAGSTAEAVGELPEKIAEGFTSKVLGPELGERAGKFVDVAEVPAAGAALLLGHHAVAGGLAAAKALEKAGPAIKGAGEFVERVAQADPLSPFGRLYTVAKDTTAPEWMRALANSWVTKIPAELANATKTGAKSAAVGGLFGAGLGAVSSDNAEQFGESIGAGAGFGVLTAGASYPKLKRMQVMERTMADIDRFYQAHIADGIAPEDLKKVGDDAMTWGAVAERIFGNGTKVRFAGTGEGSPLPKELHGQAGMWQPETKTLWINVDAQRNTAATVLHEMFHPIFDSEVANRPEIKQQIDTALAAEGKSVDMAKQIYAYKVLQPQLAAEGITDPLTVQQRIADWVAKQDAQFQQSSGDPNSWVYSEILSEAAARSLHGQHPIFDVLSPSITSQAMEGIKGFLENLGVTFKQREVNKPATILPGFENVIDTPELRKLTYSLLKAQKEFMPGITEGKTQGVKIDKTMVGQHPSVPAHEVAPGVKGNDFFKETAPGSGKFEQRPRSETSRIFKSRRQEVNEIYPANTTPLSETDTTPGIAVRRTPSGLVERSGTELGDAFYNLKSFGQDTKEMAKDLEGAIKNGEARSGWYQQIGESPDWKESVGKDFGALEAQFKDFIPINFLVDKQGNLLVRNYSLTALDRKAAEWRDRKGTTSLQLWGGDIGAFKRDLALYLENHKANLPGEANNLGVDKKNVLNAFLVGANRTFEITNPLRKALKGSDRQGIVRAYRLDRLETLQQAPTEFVKPEYAKQVVNLSPEDVGEGIVNDAQQERAAVPKTFSPDVAEKPTKKGELPYTVGNEKIPVVHLSANNALKTVDPKFFGTGRATKRDTSGGNKSYWFVAGSKLMADTNVFGQGGYKAYVAELDGSKIYDLRGENPDALGYFDTINRWEADDALKKAGYDGVIVDTADGRSVVMLYTSQKVTAAGDFKGEVATVPGAEKTTDYRNSGLAFKDFFSKATKGEIGQSAVGWKPIMDIGPQKGFREEQSKHTGNFDEHIAKSIPGFREAQVKTGNSIVKSYPKGATVLDIAASEGSYGKTISALSKGKVKTVSLDPNPDMAQFFREKSKVPGATYDTSAFLNGFEDNGIRVPAYNPKKRFDVIHESMGFQFISPERAAQIAEAKRLMKPDGVFLTEQKVLNDNWAANEAKKDADYKANYFTEDELAKKNQIVGFQQSEQETQKVGMLDNMVRDTDLEATLKKNFKHVVQYWDSGNFKGYASSDSLPALQKLVKNIGNLNNDFSTVNTPRNVSNELIGGKYSPDVRDTNKEHVITAALQMPDGKVFTGGAHAWAAMAAEEAGYGGKDFEGATEGFTTNKGRFVDRDEAHRIAMAANQIDIARARQVEERFGTEENYVTSSQFPLESVTFNAARKFSPDTLKKEIDLEGPDGKTYKARFDGYQDMSVVGKGMVPQITLLEPIPGVGGMRTTTYAPALEKRGVKLPALPSPNQFSPDAPAQYSQLEKVVKEKFSGEAMPKAQLLAMLRNPQSGVKAEEMKWTGMDEMLKGSGKITRNEMEMFLEQNRTKIYETQAESPAKEVDFGYEEAIEPNSDTVAESARDNFYDNIRDELETEWTEEERDFTQRELDDAAMEKAMEAAWEDANENAGWTARDSTHGYELRNDGYGESSVDVYDPNGYHVGNYRDRRRAIEAAQEDANRAYGGEGEGKYSEWKLDGPNDNYRELLFVLQPNRSKTEGLKSAILSKKAQLQEAINSDPELQEISKKRQEASDMVNAYGSREINPEDNSVPLPEGYSATDETLKAYADSQPWAATMQGYTPEAFRTEVLRLYKQWAWRDYYSTLYEKQEALRNKFSNYDKEIDALQEQLGGYGSFEGPHWDESDVLAHSRVDDRKNSKGQDGLFIEEIQSDWHQRGRKHGYIGDVPKFDKTTLANTYQRLKKEAEDKGYVIEPSQGMGTTQWIKNSEGKTVASMNGEGGMYHGTDDPYLQPLLDAYQRAIQEHRNSKSAVPQAPLRNTWHEFVFRQLVRKAVDQGADWIGWTTGEQQAARYDLSKRVSRLEFVPTDYSQWDTGSLIAYDLSGRQVFAKRATPAEFEEYIGKEPAKKLESAIAAKRWEFDQFHVVKENPSLFPGEPGERFYVVDSNGEPVRDTGGGISYFDSEPAAQKDILLQYSTLYNTEPNADIKGLDLTIGGEGMKGFYDKILVDYANKFGKKFGSKVVTDEVVTKRHARNPARIYEMTANKLSTITYEDALKTFQEPNEMKTVYTKTTDGDQSYYMRLDTMGGVESRKGSLFWSLPEPGPVTEEIHMLPITEAMQKSAL